MAVTAADPITSRLESAGVPRRFLSCRLATFSARPGTRAALQAVRSRAIAADARGLVLSGPPGTGKTHLAVGLLADEISTWLERYPATMHEIPDDVDDPVLGKPRTVAVARRPPYLPRFVVVPSLLDELRQAAAWGGHDDPLAQLIEAELLVLDDLGREKVTDWATERLYVLVNARYNALLPTVVTTNYAMAELVDRGYDALVSRLMEGVDLVRIEASDYRVKGGR